ncbi:hypothetical protein CO058_03800 [candidate division WWE3 bacterium CG_4_9_14_0_2_um_filter_35_11]|uniref:Large ribosomal subunit protein uL29 n=1 Tax=candidate division WWE3 bacterium CG_4_9_14_0_2_um_filter_35_11 TaxID=1975077 RepID=A0A2M8EL55_UNCKA|nr:MAG: hypothetical protein COV25_02500 [candidate division WWE3 bacterium CG10_big_fil_rev_8_21_14_0_10_35_32]PJC23427.1 MAG: hypothetical protein CO058_03800 [candidate division WWE3 bacterium CG_4_9_14_0_2_um_filter_35_11]
MEKIDTLRKLDIEKLKTTLSEAREKHMDKRLNKGFAKVKDTTLFAKSKKYIARIQTLIQEKEILK